MCVTSGQIITVHSPTITRAHRRSSSRVLFCM
ncbi:hypothetical protein BIW11_13695 [Tropilaelaps mercedesae]|uniref:Uncharacterized protein n=1 Tax=Tropilaelaps mercedesae TaxID=418985 RepID=A0A1V9X156_9ACAR|nr:hypothetical protein BIW11_13695 [Tropilaelaps mercedesae]